MPGLADLILSRPQSLADVILAEPEEPELEDQDLERELAELRAKREALQLESAARSRAPTAPRPPVAPPTVSAAERPLTTNADDGRGDPSIATSAAATSALGRTQTVTASSALGGTQTVTASSALGWTQKAAPQSLADEILRRSEAGVGDVDRELKAMDEELQKQLSALRQQREAGGSGVSQALGPVPPTTLPESRPAPQDAGDSAEATATSWRPDSATAAPELAGLIEEAQRLEQVFPDAPGESEADNVVEGGRSAAAKGMLGSKRRYRPSRPGMLEDKAAAVAVADAPVDDETSELKHALEDLDVKLRTIQKMEESFAGRVQTRGGGCGGTGAGRVIEEIQRQNAHLRERFKMNSEQGGKGMLHLDRGMFVKLSDAKETNDSGT